MRTQAFPFLAAANVAAAFAVWRHYTVADCLTWAAIFATIAVGNGLFRKGRR